ncbi:hypothetical protein PFLUV_G00191490 [Perca fluviatilis]|uniref:Uncharacterized protein n=1 Tax=Perca fluviatilis TaxID=8168 RepID=A0A6A5DV31_PERFL|nr:hypothetical protein PFLUV_G00191490 [Perca fluviatilis]
MQEAACVSMCCNVCACVCVCVESNAALEFGRRLTDARNPLLAVGEDTCRLCFTHHRELTGTHTGHTGSLCKGQTDIDV